LTDGKASVGNDTTDSTLEIRGKTTGYSSVDFYSGSTNEWGIGKDTAGDFYIDKSGGGRIITILASNEYVGIGTISPNHKLTVSGNINITGSGNGIKFPDGTTQITAADGSQDCRDNNGFAGVPCAGCYTCNEESGVCDLLGSECLVECGEPITDADGNTYNTVQIGDQCWMATNLKNSANGCREEGWGTGRWCGWHGGIDHGDEGLLYQWSAAMNNAPSCNGAGVDRPACTTPVQGLCPVFWHIPSHDEFTALEREVCDTGSQCFTDFLYDESTIGWRGSDESLQLKASPFSHLLAGYRSASSGGVYEWRGTYGFLWSSYAQDATGAWTRNTKSSGQIDRRPMSKIYSLSVRCIKD
ncbi:hypothetical protein CMO93_01750, partial [Candidatus Woesearchaeota archaeon]|nr:hypothetical protein [Candidatus Woesearchaeota archaeon]